MPGRGQSLLAFFCLRPQGQAKAQSLGAAAAALRQEKAQGGPGLDKNRALPSAATASLWDFHCGPKITRSAPSNLKAAAYGNEGFVVHGPRMRNRPESLRQTGSRLGREGGRGRDSAL